MFAAIVLLTFPFWGLALFYGFVWLTTGGDPKGAARRKHEQKARNREIIARGERAVREEYKKGGS